VKNAIKKVDLGLVLVAHTCNPSYSGAEIRRIEVRGQPGQIVHETLSQKYST
jgi:hypothetical protein